MSENEKSQVDTNSSEFNQGVEAGLNSEEDTKNWKAGNELGQELKEESDTQKPSGKLTHREYSDPLFLQANPEGQKGNAQDEKDETAE
jgi:hypothetical protein